MLTEVILEQVSEVIEQSEVDVLIAIGESYCKYFSALACSPDLALIQESSIIFVEDGEDKKNVIDKIKDVFVKAASYIKAAFQKIFSFVKKKFWKYTGQVYGTINLLAFADAIIQANPDSVVTEYDIIEEALTPEEEQGRKEALKRFEEKKASVKKDLKNFKASEKDVARGLKKYYVNDVNRKILSNENINDLVNTLKKQLSKNDFIKLQHELARIGRSNKPAMSKFVDRNLAMVDDLYESMTKSARAEQEFLTQMNIQWKSDIRGEKDIEMRLDMVKKFADTLGKTLDELNGTKNFTYEKMTNDLYGTGAMNTALFSELIVSFKNILKNVPKVVTRTGETVNRMNEVGEKLYQAHKEFDNAVFEDERTRQELGMKANNSVKALLFALNQIKEESYGYTDDEVFNKKAYDDNSPLASYLGGPFSMVLKSISVAIGGPIGLSIGVGDVLMYITQRSTAKALNSSSSKIVSDREAYEYTDSKNPLRKIPGAKTHMQRAIENLPSEEQKAIIQKSKEDLQRKYDDDERKRRLGKNR